MKKVLITGTGGRSVGSGILHSLLRADIDVKNRWEIIASDADSFAWGLYVAPNGILLPLAKDPNYIKIVKEIVDRFEIDAIVPGTEPETTVLSANTSEFKNCKIICNRPELMPLMNDKFFLEKTLSELGLKTIKTFPITEWEVALRCYDFPFIVKPTTGTGGSKGLLIITNQKELEEFLNSVIDKSIYCIQPYIGDADNEYTVGILSDKDGAIIDSIVMRRKLIGLSLLSSKTLHNKNYSVSTGYSQGYIIEDKEISEFCEKIAVILNSRGPLNIQLRKHQGDFYIFDFHPRFSGTTPIRASVGFNEVDILLRNHLFGEKFQRLNYKKNVAAIRAFEHVIVPITDMK